MLVVSGQWSRKIKRRAAGVSRLSKRSFPPSIHPSDSRLGNLHKICLFRYSPPSPALFADVLVEFMDNSMKPLAVSRRLVRSRSPTMLRMVPGRG
jgi:hypothetical protein